MPRDSFIGREADLVAVCAALRAGARLLTIIGPPGVGKTRFAAEFVKQVQADGEAFGDEAHFCDLTSARGPDDLCRRVATQLGVPLCAHDRLDDAGDVGTALRRVGSAVLVLDNFEQLVTNSALIVAGWLERAPAVRIVITSREPLNLRGEYRFPLGCLSLPPDAPDHAVWQSESGQLLAARMRERRPDFAPSETNAHQAGELLRLFDGLPLAIELAAAQAASFGIEPLWRRLREGRADLRSERRDENPRHLSLEAAIATSWAPLSAPDRAALQQIGCFRGGFDLDGVNAIVDLSRWSDGPEAARVVVALCERSLVQVETPACVDRPRYRVLESIREFLRPRSDEQLVTAAAQRHRHYYAGQGLRWRRLAPRDRGAMRRLALELDNLLSALAGCPIDTAEDLRCAAALALAVHCALLEHGPVSLDLSVLDSVLDAAASAQLASALRTELLLARAGVRAKTGLLEAARCDLGYAADCARRSGAQTRTLERRVGLGYGWMHYLAGELVPADECFSRLLAAHGSGATDVLEIAVSARYGLARIAEIRGQRASAIHQMRATCDAARIW